MAEALFLAVEDELTSEVRPLIEELFKITVSDKYDTLLIVVVVIFYAIDAAVKLVTSGLSQASLSNEKLAELCNDLALETGKTPDNVKRIIEAKYTKSSKAKALDIKRKKNLYPKQNGGKCCD